MKIFISILICIFSLQSLSKANDIRDFEIEGISIGDSLLVYFNEKKILEYKQVNQFPKSDKFIISTFYDEDFFEVYDSVSTSYKNNKKYILHSIEGRIFFENDIQACLQKKKDIADNIKNSFNNLKKYEGEKNHRFDKSGKSKYIYLAYEFESGDYIQVSCTDWSAQIESKGFSDELKVSMASREFGDFMDNEAY